MASNYTTNYQLNQWEAGDQVLRTEFNQDNQKIDAALAGLDSRAGALESILDGIGNCQIYHTTYVGTGGNGQGSPNTFTFPHKPMAVFVAGTSYHLLMFRGSSTTIGLQHGSSLISSQVNWTENGVSWYNGNSYGNGPQCNERGQTYQLVALLDAEA